MKLFKNSYGTHQGILYKIASQTNGPILECGCGFSSTPMLHEICRKLKRPLLTLESNKEWLDKFVKYENSWHKFIYVSDWNNALSLNEINKSWDVVFIDQSPWEARYETVKKLKDKSQYIVLHDCNYFPENGVFGNNISQLNSAKDRGDRDYSDEFKFHKEYFPDGLWPDRRTGPPTLLGSNFNSCDIKPQTFLYLASFNVVVFLKEIIIDNTKKEKLW